MTIKISCSNTDLEELVEQEGEPVGEHFLGHRLGSGGRTGGTEKNTVSLSFDFSS